MRKIIFLLMISMLLVGCSDNQTALPDSKTLELQSPQNASPTSPVGKSGETEKASSGIDNRVPPASSSPVIVQSAPEPTNNADAVLDDISQELDSLTDILNGMEEPDTAWDEEVDQQ